MKENNVRITLSSNRGEKVFDDADIEIKENGQIIINSTLTHRNFPGRKLKETHYFHLNNWEVTITHPEIR